MIAIITEKPSVGQDIARVVGATEKYKGYFKGNGYIVTWALGHLVQLALPEYYGHKRGTSDLPLIPDPFQLTIRHTKRERKYITDPVAARQLNVIDKVLSECQGVIAATDAGREGELIFRYILAHTASPLPFRRLWISSLTDEAIETGFRNLRDGRCYDTLYLAADCRAKADWLVGINASAALAKATGQFNHSLGRVQTPTLALVCSRYLENRGFLPSDYWRLHITLEKDSVLHTFRYDGEIRDEVVAGELAGQMQECPEAVIGNIERKAVQEQPPLLYDLTTLQKDCNVLFDMTAEKTLETAQALYEKKLISYPRTGSRYISPDILPQVPSLLRMILRMERFSHFPESIDTLKPNKRSVDAAKVTDHHALLITGNYPATLTASEERVYHLIAGRMLEAFGPKCTKESLTVEATADGLPFLSRTSTITSPGWRGVFNRPEVTDEPEQPHPAVDFTEGETLPVKGSSISKHKTRPQPLYTEATLLGAMEMPCQRGQSEHSSALPRAAGIRGSQTAGKHIEDEQAREAMRDCGIGTPATRASIITTLFTREYIERSGKSLIPTEKGLYVYKAVKDMLIADAELTGNWEKSLASIERGTLTPETFMEHILIYTRKVTEEILALNIPSAGTKLPRCPKCRTGKMTIRHKIAKCGNPDCGLVVFRRFLNKEMSDENMRQLLTSGKTKPIKGFKGKGEKTFDAQLALDKNYNVTFYSPPKKKTAAGRGGKPKKTTSTKTGAGGKPGK